MIEKKAHHNKYFLGGNRMKSQRRSFRSILVIVTILCFVCSLNFMTVFASGNNNIIATPTKTITSNTLLNETKIINEDSYYSKKLANGVNSMATEPFVAALSIFSDPSTSVYEFGSGLSIDLGTHSFITIKNISGSNLTIGNISGVAPNKTISMGTWSSTRTSEHNGLWYNLEAYKIYGDPSVAYYGRVSIAWRVTQTQLNAINSYISTVDNWSYPNPCSGFAVGVWNMTVDSIYRLSDGIPSTPKNLAASITSCVSGYTVRASVPYDYCVYYARGGNTPAKSTIYNLY